jgi:hypothetical protein
MKSLIKFNAVYFILAVVLFGVEVLIGLFAHDRFIRPYLGDVLVVMLLYCIVKSFLNTPIVPTALSVLVCSFIVEGLQYLNIVDKLGLKNSKIAPVLLGTSFAWADMVAYAAGILIVLMVEKLLGVRRTKAESLYRN